MNVLVIYEDIKEHGFELAVIIGLLLKFIEISPLRLNPWTKLKKWFKNLFTGEVKEEILHVSKQLEDQKKDLIELKQDLNEERAKTSRYRIIRFDDEMTHGVIHSDDHKEQIMEDISVYETFCAERPYIKNHKGIAAMERISNRYKQQLPM